MCNQNYWNFLITFLFIGLCCQAQNHKSGNSIDIELYNQTSSYYIPDNLIIREHIQRYLEYKWFSKAFGVFKFYEPMIELKMLQYNIPIELKYLAIVESTMNPRATSSVGAKGLWQFMPETAKEYQLLWNSKVDLRYDPIASTDVACRYLKWLYKELKNWNLVLSAYNSGIGNVKKAIRNAGTTNYWKVRSFLPFETQKYTPSFMAICYLGEMRHNHQITSYKLPYNFHDLITLKANESIDFDIILNQYSTAIERKFIHYINPHILTNEIPKNTYFYLLKNK